jgi:hypothetical protein
MVVVMKRFGDFLGAAMLVGVIGYVTIRIVETVNNVLQPMNTAAQPQQWLEPEMMDDGGVANSGWRVVDPTEFALPDEQREQVTVLRPGESLLPWLEEENV